METNLEVFKLLHTLTSKWVCSRRPWAWGHGHHGRLTVALSSEMISEARRMPANHTAIRSGLSTMSGSAPFSRGSLTILSLPFSEARDSGV